MMILGHHCVEGWRPWSRVGCSNRGCVDAQEGVRWVMWCARCELAYEYAFATEVGMPTLWTWLMAHHGYDLAMRHVTPQCPKTPTYDDIADTTLRRLGQMPGGQLGGAQ